MKRYLLGGVLIGAVIAALMLIFLVINYDREQKEFTTSQIKSFEDCAAAGYPIAESYPRQCIVPNGPSFSENININVEDGLEFVTITQGAHGLDNQQNKIISNKSEWQKLWQQLELKDKATPNIDLTDYVILAVFAGKRGTGGRSITIERIAQEGSSFKAFISEASPGGNCAATGAFTSPYHIVALKLPYPEGVDRKLYRPNWNLENFEFETNQVINDC